MCNRHVSKICEKVNRRKRKTPLQSGHDSLAKVGNDFHPTPQTIEYNVSGRNQCSETQHYFLRKTVGEFPTALRNFIKRVRGLEFRGSRGDITKEVGRARGIYKQGQRKR
jgi:hypothetical protein